MTAITQTGDGFLWFVSQRNGELYRFDGVQFRLWQLPADAGSIGRLRNILADKSGGLWLIGVNGLAHLKSGVITFHASLDGIMYNQGNMTIAADGSLWVVRGSNGTTEPLCHVTDSAVKCFGKSDGVPSAPIDAIMPDGKGGFWLGGQAALVHWDGRVSETYPIQGLQADTGTPGIVSLARGPDGSLWVGIFGEGPGRGLARLDRGVLRSFVSRNFDGSKVDVFSMRMDQDGNLWVGTSKDGIFRVHGTAVDHYGRSEGLSSSFVFSLFEDREGIIWASTNSGVDRFHDPIVTTFTSVEGLGEDLAAGVLATRSGGVWVANGGSLDRIQNGDVSSIKAGHGLPGQQVSSLLEDHTGNLWVGVEDGLYRFNNGRFVRVPEPKHQPIGLVFGLIEDSDGNLWAESASTGNFVRIHNFRVEEEFPRSKIPTGPLAADPNGGFWIGVYDGTLALFRGGTLQKHSTNSGSQAFQIVASKDGSVLAAYGDGLVGLRQGKTQRLSTKNGLPCDAVYAFAIDNANRWWLSTKCGILEFPDSELQRWWMDPSVIIQSRLFDVLDGARPGRATFNPAAISTDGRVWFASSGLVQMIDPSRLSHSAVRAQTYIDSITVDRKQFKASDNLQVAPHPRDIQIDYTSPTLLIPQRVRFRYRLDNFDTDWHEAGTRRQAFYTDLPPGNYTFRVMACNSDGVWNDTAGTFDFSIAPAYYQTIWFRVISALFILALVWAIYQFRMRQLQHQFEMTLNARVAERTRIAREIHDTLLQSFHGLLLRFQTVLQLLPGRPAEAREKLESAIQQAAEAITEGRDTVQGLRESTVQSNDLAVAISTMADELSVVSGSKPPSFHVAVEGESRNLHPIVRDEIYKIAAEALRNAFQHAEAKQIEVEIRYDIDQFRLRVRDDGKGIDPMVLSRHAKEGHFGLNGMRERATVIGGTLDIWSEIRAGTEIELCVPSRKAYAGTRERSWLSLTFGGRA